MFIEAPITTEVTTDPTLDHLHKLKELLSQEDLWCTSSIDSQDPITLKHQHCVLGLAVLALGKSPFRMSTDQAVDYIQENDSHMYPAMSKAGYEQIGYYSSVVDINDGKGYAAVVNLVDRAIEIRKAEL